ncbi:MAG: zinc dependent phospholipase C family protein [Clostridia bacterium]|nr:zinc dependent phospholipase C family protein [Clostridia bacterium]
MLCATHRLIAHTVYNALSNDYPISLDYDNLLKGSVAPDSAPTMVIIPHTKTKSIGFVTKQVEWLLNTDPAEEGCKREFSFRLGVVIHFISDYFCRAHNEFKYLNPILHFIYENRLKKFFSKNIPCFSFKKTEPHFKGNIKEYIYDFHNQYKLNKKSMENDFYYSLLTTISISRFILSNAKAYETGIITPELKLTALTA